MQDHGCSPCTNKCSALSTCLYICSLRPQLALLEFFLHPTVPSLSLGVYITADQRLCCSLHFLRQTNLMLVIGDNMLQVTRRCHASAQQTAANHEYYYQNKRLQIQHQNPSRRSVCCWTRDMTLLHAGSTKSPHVNSLPVDLSCIRTSTGNYNLNTSSLSQVYMLSSATHATSPQKCSHCGKKENFALAGCSRIKHRFKAIAR